MGEYCYFQAGVAGQRAGVTVVTLGDNEHIRAPETVRTLAVHVLPKIWSPNGRRNIIEPLPADRPHPTHLLDETGCLHVYLYEREILKLPADCQATNPPKATAGKTPPTLTCGTPPRGSRTPATQISPSDGSSAPAATKNSAPYGSFGASSNTTTRHRLRTLPPAPYRRRA